MAAVRAETALARICDLAGRPRGTAFAADGLGTLITSHEAVDGLSRIVVHTSDGRTCLAEAGQITPLPEWDLALVRATGLALPPLVTGAGRPLPDGAPVRLWDGDWLDARIIGSCSATYTSTDRYHPLDGVLVLALPDAAAAQLRLSRRASGTPVLDGVTGSVVGVLGTALHAPRGGRAAAFAVPPHLAALPDPDGPMARLLRRNGATVPGFGSDLNLAGALQLTGLTVGPPPVSPPAAGQPVARPEIAEELRRFGGSGAFVTGLVGDPGTGRTTELAMYAQRRTRGVAPAPTVWLRGADLREGDDSVRAAVGRALEEAGRILLASGGAHDEVVDGSGAAGHVESGAVPVQPGHGSREQPPTGWIAPEPGTCRWGELPTVGDPRETDPDIVARLARQAGRALLVVLDAPEEMPPRLAYDLRRWTAGTSSWLRSVGARMATACRPEFWEQAGAFFPDGMLYVPGGGPDAAAGSPVAGRSAGGGPLLPPCVRVGDLPPGQAVRARARYGLPDGAVARPDSAHPLALRMLAEVRGAQWPGAGPVDGAGRTAPRTARETPGTPPRTGRSGAAAPVATPPADECAPGRAEIFAAYLDLTALRVARRLASADLPAPPGGVVRRLAARVAGQLHEAARYCLGPGQGQLDGATFEQLFPWGGGWAPSVLAAGVLIPAGDGYRFADEEFGDWLQGTHLQLDGALAALVYEAGERRPDGAGSVPVPRYRIGPVVQALLLCARREGPPGLSRRLRELIAALPLPEGEAGPAPVPSSHAAVSGARAAAADAASARAERAWWATHLLGETLLRLPDAEQYTDVLDALAGHVVAAGGSSGFGPLFWRRLPLGTAARVELLRLLLPADPPHGADAEGEGGGAAGRFLEALGELLTAEPRTVQPLLCSWFSDERALRQPRTPQPGRTVRGDAGPPTVADAAQALLHTHRARDTGALLEALADSPHPRAGELLAELARDEPSALCRAVARWARDPRAERRRTAAVYGLRASRHTAADTDRDLLRTVALGLLSRPGDRPVHGHALALLVRDPARRLRHLDEALAHFTETGSPALASALGAALETHHEPVLAAFRVRQRNPEAEVREGLRALAEARGTCAVRRAACLVREYAELLPRTSGDAVALFVRRRLAGDASAHGVLRPLLDELLRVRPATVRVPLARVLGAAEEAPGAELRSVLLAGESDPLVLDALLDASVRHGAAAYGADGAAYAADRRNGAPWTDGADGVRRIGALMAQTTEGAALFDMRLVALARNIPGFAARLAAWTQRDPQAWAPLIGPAVGRTCAALAESPGA